jgi:catechol 2,3-dioxygenase-like lactoylglutathione lyase family enzyme
MKMGSIFPELYVQDVQHNIRFFTEALNFKLIRDEGDFAELHLGTSILLLNGYAGDVEGHYFFNKIDSQSNGIGVEIGIVVKDIYSVHKKIKAFGSFKSITEIKKQDWGMTDFRLVTMDNYYLRITMR